MSILNMTLGGGGGGSFGTASPTSIASDSISFSIGAEPKEYILMMLFSSAGTSFNGRRTVCICHTTEYDYVSYVRSPSSSYNYYTIGTFSYLSTSYSNGVFTITTSDTTSTGEFVSGYSYALFYR